MLHDAPPKLIVNNDDGFLNLDLGLVSIERTATRGLLVHARARHGDTMLGFAIIFDPDWEDEPIDADTGSFFWGTGTLLRTGPRAMPLSRSCATSTPCQSTCAHCERKSH